ncbi:MAG: hypothetical protein WCP08_11360 [Prolixibacteraceae bacterium]
MKKSGRTVSVLIFSVLILLFFFPVSGFPTSSSGLRSPISSVYQFAVPVGGRKAYLWIPEECHYVRGLIISMENMLERNWLEDTVIRQTAAREGLGIIWLADGKPTNITFEMKPDAMAELQQMFADLARESGYSEIEFAPLIVMGHSWNGRMAWNYPNANPERVLAAIPIRTYTMPDKLNFSGIPLCYVVGETTELPQFSDGRPGDRDFYWPIVRQTAVKLRIDNPDNLIGVVTDPGGNHTDWSDHQADFVALFIRKACHYRLPDKRPVDGKASLRKITRDSGWLTDTGGMEPDRFEPAAYSQFKGDPTKAYWFFDEEMARAAVSFSGDRKKRDKQMPSFIQDGKILPVDKTGYVQLKFQPNRDGVTFHLKGGFLSEVPESLIGAGTNLGHGNPEFSFSVTCGPVVQIDKYSFRIQFDRQAFRLPVIQVVQNGNNQYRRALQPGKLNIKPKNYEGMPQEIIFPEIRNQKRGVGRMKLKAIADSGLPVRYYVESGPAIIKGNQLIFTKIPPRSKLPLKVTIVAWQWGRTIDPLFQTAETVCRTFMIQK